MSILFPNHSQSLKIQSRETCHNYLTTKINPLKQSKEVISAKVNHREKKFVQGYCPTVLFSHQQILALKLAKSFAEVFTQHEKIFALVKTVVNVRNCRILYTGICKSVHDLSS